MAKKGGHACRQRAEPTVIIYCENRKTRTTINQILSVLVRTEDGWTVRVRVKQTMDTGRMLKLACARKNSAKFDKFVNLRTHVKSRASTKITTGRCPLLGV